MLRRFPVLRRRLVEQSLASLRSDSEINPLTAEFVEQGLYEGQSILVLDMDLCTRCDECTKGCIREHGDESHGLPITRLLRDGLRFGDYLVATSCRSCTDPHCMSGCPVDSIHRGKHLQIVIEDHCIGCGLCASNCPYGNIFMVPNQRRIVEVLDPTQPRGTRIIAQLKAATCDLCDAEGNRSSPQAAMRRFVSARSGVTHDGSGIVAACNSATRRTLRRGRDAILKYEARTNGNNTHHARRDRAAAARAGLRRKSKPARITCWPTNQLPTAEPKPGRGRTICLLAALGACTSMTVGWFARSKKIPLEDVRVELRHSKIHALDCAECETKQGKIDRIELELHFTGNITDEQRAKLLDIAGRCPVHKTLKSEIDIRTKLA